MIIYNYYLSLDQNKNVFEVNKEIINYCIHYPWIYDVIAAILLSTLLQIK